jgi:uncharacterized Zn ribbon protein
MKQRTQTCDECESEYLASSSKMVNLCPECADYLYGYENCPHQMKNGICINCLYNGKSPKFIARLKDSK